MTTYLSVTYYGVIALIIAAAYIFFMDKFVVSMRLKDINLYSFSFYYSSIILLFPGAVIIVSGIVDDIGYYRLTSDISRHYAYYAFLSSYILFGFVTFILSFLFGKPDINKFRDPQLFSESKGVSFVLNTVFVIAVILVVYVVLLLRGDLPILHLFKGDIVTANTLRVQNPHTYGNPVYNILASYYIPFATFTFFILNKITPNNKYKIYFYILLPLCIFYLIHSVERAPVLKFMVLLIVMQIFFQGWKNRYFLYGLIIITLAFVFYGLTRTFGFSDIEYLMYRVIHRLFISQSGGMFLAFEWFPYVITTPMHLQGIPTVISDLFDIPRYNSAREVMVYFQGDAPHLGVHNSHYIGGAWASYNIAGLVVGPTMVALNFYLFHKLAEHVPRNIWILAPAYYFSFVMVLSPSADYRAFAYFIMLQVPVLLWLIIVSINYTREAIVRILNQSRRETDEDCLCGADVEISGRSHQ